MISSSDSNCKQVSENLNFEPWFRLMRPSVQIHDTNQNHYSQGHSDFYDPA